MNQLAGQKYAVKSQQVLVFSVALNGYQWLYPAHLASHKRYASKYGFQHLLIKRPYVTSLGVECCWLKLAVMQYALQSGFKRVLFVDADAFIQANAPDIREVELTHKHVYMAKGYSQRFNSGVLYADNSRLTLDWLSHLLANRKMPLPAEDDVGWGENGHIIHFAKDQPFVQEIDQRWNNTYQNQLKDFIRHFNYGPMRASKTLGLVHKCLNLGTRAMRQCKKLSLALGLKHSNEDEVAGLMATVTKHYREQLQAHNQIAHPHTLTAIETAIIRKSPQLF